MEYFKLTATLMVAAFSAATPAAATTVQNNISSCFNVTHPAISPDGMNMLFVSDKAGNQDIYVSNLRSGSIRQLTFSESRESRPSWSSDGSKIAFDLNRYQSNDIFVMKADGTEPQRLTKNTAVDMFASFSPDNRQIAFHSDRSGDREIFTMNSDGSNIKNLSKKSGRDGVPSWSLDGKKILFHSTRTGHLLFQLYEMDADGENTTKISRSAAPEEHLSLSPDGHYIAYYREHPERIRNAEIYVLDRRTNQAVLAVAHDAYQKIGEYAPPAWFPDSKHFAFWATDKNQKCSSIFIKRVDGANPTDFKLDWANFEI